MTTQDSTPGFKDTVAKVKLGECMFGRHEHCRKVSVDGRVCPCDCGDQHGTKYVPLDINTPMHVMCMKIVEAHKKGERYTLEADTDENAVAPVIELNYQVTRKPVEKEPDYVDVLDTLEELEAKRN